MQSSPVKERIIVSGRRARSGERCRTGRARYLGRISRVRRGASVDQKGNRARVVRACFASDAKSGMADVDGPNGFAVL